MEPEVLAGMIFTLVLVLLIGGFVVLLPLTRRLGLLLESRIQKETRPGIGSTEELRQVREALLSIEQQLRTLAERLEFTEQLLASRERASLPRGAAPGDERD